MKTQLIDRARAELSPKKLFLSLGGFDGIHLGHQSLIKELVRQAKKNQAPSALGLFDPLPFQVLQGKQDFKRLWTLLELESLLKPLGLDFFLIIPFSKEFSRYSPSQFVHSFLIPHFKPLGLLLGYDFSYAHKRKGNFNSLKKEAQKEGFSLQQVPAVFYKNQPISSSRIRKQLLQGNIPEVSNLLGRPYFIESRVLKGQGRGKKLGFPTANLQLQNREYPPLGVYAGQAFLKGRSYQTVINIGVRPTFCDNKELFVEAHIPHYEGGPFYGEVLKLELDRFIRKEQVFSSAMALKKQIQKDIQALLG